MKFFTADTHFNHQTIIEACGRPHRNVKAMNIDMISRWNKMVREGDLVYHLGDFALPNKGDGHSIDEILEQLNGQIYLIRGNHDDKNMNLYKNWTHKFVKITHLAYIKLWNDKKVMLCHYPMLSWRASNYGTYHLHGHSHGNLPKRRLALDVGVDAVGFQPIPETVIPIKIWDYPKLKSPEAKNGKLKSE